MPKLSIMPQLTSSRRSGNQIDYLSYKYSDALLETKFAFRFCSSFIAKDDERSLFHTSFMIAQQEPTNNRGNKETANNRAIDIPLAAIHG